MGPEIFPKKMYENVIARNRANKFHKTNRVLKKEESTPIINKNIKSFLRTLFIAQITTIKCQIKAVKLSL